MDDDGFSWFNLQNDGKSDKERIVELAGSALSKLLLADVA